MFDAVVGAKPIQSYRPPGPLVSVTVMGAPGTAVAVLTVSDGGGATTKPAAADEKLRILPLSADGSILAKLKLSDVDVKVLRFPQMGAALANKAIDAALLIPPFTYEFLDQHLAVNFAEPDQLVQPNPMTIAVISSLALARSASATARQAAMLSLG